MNETTNKPSKVKTFFFCLWVMTAIILIQSAVSIIGLIPKAVQFLSEAGGMNERFTELYNDYIAASPILTVLTFTAEIVCLAVALIWYYVGYVRKDKLEGKYVPFHKKIHGLKDAGFMICGCLATFGLAVTLSMIMSALMPQTAASVNETLNAALGGYQVLGIVTGVILAPVMEEITMRGIILQHSKRAFGVVGCIIISAVLFGIFHLNPIQGIYVLPMGLFWGFVGYRYNSVIPCIFCHMINNFIGILVPVSASPIIIFAVFGAAAAFIGVRLGFFSDEKEVTTNV